MQQNNGSSLLSIIILGCLFFVFGFVTWLNSTLIIYLKIACQLTDPQALLVAFAFYISYFVMALPSSSILEKTGFKKGMMIGLFVMAAGALSFIPAAYTRNYSLFLAGLFIIGTGLSLLQTAVNPYVTIVGPIESAAKRISIMGICNKVAGVFAPLVLGAVVLKDVDPFVQQLKTMNETQQALHLNELASRVILPYTIMAVVLVALGLMVKLSPLPEVESEAKADDTTNTSLSDAKSVFAFPNLVLGVIALFLYVGVEVLAADTIGPYAQSLGIAFSQSRYLSILPLSAMVVGYILGLILIPDWISQSKALAISAIAGTLFSLLAVVTQGYASVLSIAMLGLANALIWPAIWPLAIHGLGQYTKRGSAMLIMAIVGGALLPELWGHLAVIESIGHRMAYLILLPCYLFILYYSIKGHNVKSWS